MSCGMLHCDAICDKEGEWTPSKLRETHIVLVTQVTETMKGVHTAVTASMDTKNTSEVKYRESEREYSFHSWENKLWPPASVLWLRTKWASKKRWINPAAACQNSFSDIIAGNSRNILKHIQVNAIRSDSPTVGRRRPMRKKEMPITAAHWQPNREIREITELWLWTKWGNCTHRG